MTKIFHFQMTLKYMNKYFSSSVQKEQAEGSEEGTEIQEICYSL